MTNRFRQHLPAFVDGEPFEFDFETKEELLANDWIANWAKKKGFVAYEFGPMHYWTKPYDFCLKANFNDGPKEYSSYVLGFYVNELPDES